MLKELRTLIVTGETPPNEQDIWDAWNFAREKHCQVEIKWFVPHYRWWKSLYIDPDVDSLEYILQNLHLNK